MIKRVKKAIPSKIVKVYYRLRYKCPYCSTFIETTYDENLLRIKCMHCGKPVELSWDKLVTCRHCED